MFFFFIRFCFCEFDKDFSGRILVFEAHLYVFLVFFKYMFSLLRYLIIFIVKTFIASMSLTTLIVNQRWTI